MDNNQTELPPMNSEELALGLEALLFALGGPLEKERALKHLNTTKEMLEAAISLLKEAGERRGIVLVDDGKEIELRANSRASALIERVRKEEYLRDIGRAGLEVLAALLYRGTLSRAQIDFIRGVNSTQTLRTLAMRGLVRKIPNPKDERSYLYEPTTEVLAHLGITRSVDLPDYEQVLKELEALENARTAQESGEATQPQGTEDPETL